jgi:hypothetical protein
VAIMFPFDQFVETSRREMFMQATAQADGEASSVRLRLALMRQCADAVLALQQ